MTDTEKDTLEARIDELCAENERLRQYAHTLEMANLDVTARLTDYIGQYDPTDAFVAEVKAENAKLRELCHDLRKEYAYLRVRPRRFYVQHEARMAAIDARMQELGVVADG